MFRNINKFAFQASKISQQGLQSQFQYFAAKKLTQSIQRNYFQQFLPKYECRKILLRENKVINEIFRKTSLTKVEQMVEKVKDNKKKLIFFALVLLISQYTGGYEKFVFWWKYKEPIKNKLMRWFFGVKNVVPSTIVEQRLDDIKISQDSLDILSIQFREKERGLKLGLTRKYLYKVYKDLNLFIKPEDKDFFFKASGYGKLRNQKPAGINLREFLRLYQSGYEKLVKINPKLTESEYLKLFLASLDSHYSGMKVWEVEFMRKRGDFRKMMMETEKKGIVREILQNNPLISMEELDKEVQKNGLIGVGVKEKILVLNNQLTLLQIYKNYYEEKKDMSFGDKTSRYNIKLENVSQQIENVKKELEEQNQIFSGYFKNVLLFKDYVSG